MWLVTVDFTGWLPEWLVDWLDSIAEKGSAIHHTAVTLEPTKHSCLAMAGWLRTLVISNFSPLPMRLNPALTVAWNRNSDWCRSFRLPLQSSVVCWADALFDDPYVWLLVLDLLTIIYNILWWPEQLHQQHCPLPQGFWTFKCWSMIPHCANHHQSCL